MLTDQHDSLDTMEIDQDFTHENAVHSLHFIVVDNSPTSSRSTTFVISLINEF